MIPKYWVVKDTREQNGYDFHPFELCLGMKMGKLETGDYTIDGLQHLLCIERKASPEEFANNLGRDSHRFYKELDRMDSYKYKFIILEFTFAEFLNFPKYSRIPASLNKGVKITGKFMHKRITEIQLDRGIQIMFVGDKDGGYLACSRIIKTVNEKHKDLERCEIF